MNNKLTVLAQFMGQERIKLAEELKYHTYTEVGGKAKAFYIATNQKELIQILNTASNLKIPFMVLGNGTKLLVPSEGIDKLVIKNRTSFIKIAGIKGKVGTGGVGVEEALIEVDSGVSLNKLNEYLQAQQLKMLKTFSTLHSSLGGALFVDPELQSFCQKVTVWEKEEVFQITSDDLTRDQIVLSAVLKIKAKEV